MRSFTVLLLSISSLAFAQAPRGIIFDSDIAPDYDDVGAMALLHAFADHGDIKILATISCNTFETTVPTLSVINTYFGRPEIPIGVTKGGFPNKDCQQHWAQYIVNKYPHPIKFNDEAEDAIVLYRRILSVQPDSSVTIVSVGFFTNLANLLNSGPDKYSELDGKTLVARKVRQLVSMAASLGKDNTGGNEFNVVVDAKASQRVFSDWPTPMIISGFDIGEKILTGNRLVHNDWIKDSPVKDAFEVALKKDNNTKGRNSWDQTAVFVAVRGIEPLFSSRKINFRIADDGKSIPVPGDKFTYLTFGRHPEVIGAVIEDLMMHQPKR